MKFAIALMSLALFVGCGKAEPPKEKAPETKAATKTAAPAAKPAPKPAPKPAAPPADAVKDDGKVVTVALTGNDQMRFNLTEIKVAAGRTVKLTLTHVGKMPAAGMGHNFVLLKAGTDVQAFASKAIAAAATGYVPASEAGSVIASTKVIGGGESASIEFTAPAAGTYDFLCSFPGHYALMKGKFIVQ